MNANLKEYVKISKHFLLLTMTCFSGTNETPTLETIDSYMAKLHSVILESPQENESLVTTVRDIVGRLNVEG